MPKTFSYQFYRTTKDAWNAMYQAILSAQKSIYWEIYIFVDDEAGSRFVDALCDKARAGLEIKIVVDALGSWALSRLGENRLKLAGVELLHFNRPHPELALRRWFSRLWRRNHRKLLIIDEEITFIGGVNVEWLAVEWDDVFLKLTGPSVGSILRSFARTYIAAGGNHQHVRHLLKRTRLLSDLEEWQKKFRFIIHSPLVNHFSLAQKMYYRGIALAKESVNIITPYFIPDPALLLLMTQARRRGVKINLFLPKQPDYRFMGWIARAYYGLAHRAGVNVFLLPKMNHGKAMTADNKTGIVGSSNITPRSFYYNEEVGIYFDDEAMVADLNKIFEDWKAGSEPLDLEQWKKRGWSNKVKEWWAKKIEKFV